MASQKQVDAEISLVNLFEDLVQAYEQTYVSKIDSLRDNVLAARAYRNGLEAILQDLHNSYRDELASLRKSKKGRQFINKLLKRKGHAAVLLSSSVRMAGEINQKVFAVFAEFVREHGDCTVFLVGNWSQSIFKAYFPGKAYTLIDLKDAENSGLQMRKLAEEIRGFEKIELFYPKYVSLVNQVEEHVTLGDNVVALKTEDSSTQMDHYMFEPDLKDIMTFFEDQLFNSWVQQTNKESVLAHMGGRIASLEQAVVNIDTRLKQLKVQERKEKRRKKNKRQLQILASYFYHRR